MVLGSASGPLVEIADLMAGAPSTTTRGSRWSGRRIQPALTLCFRISSLRNEGAPALLDPDCIAFAVRSADNVRDVILNTELQYPKSRVLQAYAAAEVAP